MQGEGNTNILISFFKQLFKFFLKILCFLALAGAAFWLYFYVTEELPQKKVSLHAEYNLEECDAKYPIALFVENKNKKTIYKIRFNLTATRTGYSSNVLKHSFYLSDKIVPPRSRGNLDCWRVEANEEGLNLEDLNYKVIDVRAHFENE